MSKIVINKMTANDLEQVYEVDKNAFSIPWQRSSFEEELKNILATYLVAKQDNIVIRIYWDVVCNG